MSNSELPNGNLLEAAKWFTISTLKKLLILLGVHHLAARLFARIFWSHIVRPIIKYAHAHGGLKYDEQAAKIAVKESLQDDRWTHLSSTLLKQDAK